MIAELDFNRADFLREGAIFAKEGEVWLLWGAPQLCSQRPDAIAISCSDFHDRNPMTWLLFPYALQVSIEEARDLFRGCSLDRRWKPASRENFENQFQSIEAGFKEERVEKVVPYVFENSKKGLSFEELESAIAHGLGQSKGILYGLWNSAGGILGLTPEVLISQINENNFETMALAGTYPIEKYQKNTDAFLNDQKERKEHLQVVEDILSQLEGLGFLEYSDIQVSLTPHLAHLQTWIRLEKRTPVRLEGLVRRLHPTPALGCSPRSELSHYMKAFERMEPRGAFGGPFGISFSQKNADFVVAIRNLIWTPEELKIGSGCGVVPDSQLEKEWEELTNKRNSVKKIFGFLQ